MASSSESETTYPSVIELNVGGHHFTTTLMTLTKQRDTMLGAMFSGMYKQPQDKSGRYFIDADGHTFKWILSYLRTGELPPSEEAERVYHAALYFGIQDLVSELEQVPKILALQMKAKHQARFEDFDEMVKTILDRACNVSSIDHWPRSKVCVSICHKDNYRNPTDPKHVCSYPYPEHDIRSHEDVRKRVMAAVTIGPLQARNVAEKDYMEAVVEELGRRGFLVQLFDVGFCRAGENNMEVMHVADGESSCGAKMYTVAFSWK